MLSILVSLLALSLAAAGEETVSGNLVIGSRSVHERSPLPKDLVYDKSRAANVHPTSLLRSASDVCAGNRDDDWILKLDDPDANALRDKLCKLQTPTNCYDSKFVHYSWMGTGIGAAVHFLAHALTAAHVSGRTLVVQSARDKYSQLAPYFQGSHPGVHDNCDISCFLMPMSTCAESDFGPDAHTGPPVRDSFYLKQRGGLPPRRRHLW